MLYHLFEYLKDYDIPGSGLFGFLSFRAIAANVIAMCTALFGGKAVIKWLRKKQIGETVRNLGLEGQVEKTGTPTMGGVIIIFSILVAALLVCDLRNIYTQLLILTTLWCGALGFTDDWIKVFKHDKNGLSEKKKLIGQIGLGVVIALAVCFHPGLGGSTATTIPFVKSHEFDYDCLAFFAQGGLRNAIKWIIYAIVIIFIITACSNGANLTDGMDGLSAGTSLLVGVVLGILGWLGGNVINANYLDIMYLPGSGEVAVFMSAFAGALAGFLWYNTYPAEVFMGDTGSLTIGGIIGVGAVLIHKELMLPILCGIFVVESLSVIIQRSYFKSTKKKYGEGRRFFKMAPIHHHYQKMGHPEARIVTRFWIIGIILAVATLALLKIR
ncbi:MAG: phospho-N-acetylmuramoyl-pentapeptide-transferase [Bacteroidales bacterium]|nr:phospho-N-acetylmuramoyl-pentapeptide-transferase [Bacteroidales bacterium]